MAGERGGITVRLSGTPLFGWVATSGLAVVIGLTIAGNCVSPMQTLAGRSAGLVGGLVLARIPFVRCRIDSGEVRVHNWVRNHRLRPKDATDIVLGSGTVPPKGSISFSRLDLVLASGRCVPLVATTGKRPERIERVVSVLVAAAPGLRVPPDLADDFPGRGRAATEREQAANRQKRKELEERARVEHWWR